MKDNKIIWASILNNEFSIDNIDRLAKNEGRLALYAHDERGFCVLHWAVILGKFNLIFIFTFLKILKTKFKFHFFQAQVLMI